MNNRNKNGTFTPNKRHNKYSYKSSRRDGAVWNWSPAIGCLMGVEEGGEWEEEGSVRLRQKQPQRHTDRQEDNVMAGCLTNVMLVGLERTLQREAGPPCFESSFSSFLQVPVHQLCLRHHSGFWFSAPLTCRLTCPSTLSLRFCFSPSSQSPLL